jgi:abnormal spindle-like microcephaly-associated protein
MGTSLSPCLQAAARGWLLRLSIRRHAAATVLAARWRGHAIRFNAPTPRLAELRGLVIASRAFARANPGRTLGARAAAAVGVLHAPRKLREVRDALRAGSYTRSR